MFSSKANVLVTLLEPHATHVCQVPLESIVKMKCNHVYQTLAKTMPHAVLHHCLTTVLVQLDSMEWIVNYVEIHVKRFHVPTAVNVSTKSPHGITHATATEQVILAPIVLKMLMSKQRIWLILFKVTNLR